MSIRLHIALTLLYLTACAAVPGLARAGGGGLACDDPNDGFIPPLPVDTCIEERDAETPWRYIGLTTGSECPRVDLWESEKLFDVDGSPVPFGLTRYCVYTAETSPPATTLIEAASCAAPQPPQPCLESLGRDSIATVSLGGPQLIESVIWPSLFEHFLIQAGQLGQPLLDFPRVRLAVLDTEPTGVDQDLDGPGNSTHGFAILAAARDLLCPPGGDPCGVELKSNLALPLRLCTEDPGGGCPCESTPTGVCEDLGDGGHVGTVTQLAKAIRAEVRDWEDSDAQRLVLNLSLGWAPEYGSLQTPVSNSSAPVQAVYSALQDAACRGVLVVAAAGNSFSGPELFSGPLLPGGWETVEAPGLGECNDLVDPVPDPGIFGVGQYRPLVFSTAAVNAVNDRILTRVGGEPRMVAFGDHAVSDADFAGAAEPTEVQTGSSVSTAVLSSAIAAAWYFRPSAAPFELTDVIYDSGTDLGRAADFCLNGPAGCTELVRRISACTAAEKACNALPGDPCPQLDCRTALPFPPVIDDAALEELFAATQSADVGEFALSQGVGECEPGYTLKWDGGPLPANPCPQRQYYDVQATPYSDGQPSGQICPTCSGVFRSPGRLFVEITDDFEGRAEDITVLCGNDAFRLPGSLGPGGRYLVTGVPEPCEQQGVAISYRVPRNGGDASVLSPVLLVQDSDDDGAQDAVDNCLLVANPDQTDSDNDALGNRCDPDIFVPNDCAVGFSDLSILKDAFFSTPASPNWHPAADFNVDGAVNFADLAVMKEFFFGPPGPSALPGACN